jgi:hypothetical protein
LAAEAAVGAAVAGAAVGAEVARAAVGAEVVRAAVVGAVGGVVAVSPAAGPHETPIKAKRIRRASRLMLVSKHVRSRVVFIVFLLFRFIVFLLFRIEQSIRIAKDYVLDAVSSLPS